MPTGVFDKIREFAKAGSWPIYLKGQPGRGKSFVAAAAFRRWKTSPAIWMSFVDFADRSMRVAKDGEMGMYIFGNFCEFSRESWWRRFGNASLVVIDEIGSGMTHEWRNECFWNLLEARRKQPLIMTGNLRLDELADKFDERIESRINAGSIISFEGEDMRLEGIKSRSAKVFNSSK